MATTTIEKPQATSTTPERVNDGVHYTPTVDVLETADAFIFYADVPGVKSGDLDIQYEDGTLSIEAKVQPRQTADQQYLVQEYGVGNFSRSFDVAVPINPDGIRIELKNGKLVLTVPKAESAKTRKIQIKTE